MTYNPYMNQLNPYQQLDALRQQAAGIQQQQYLPQQPYTPQMPQQAPQPVSPMPNIQALIQQEVQRQIAGMQPQYAPQQQLMPPAQPQVPPGIAIMQAVGNQMTVGDQQWISANLHAMPGFFNTPDGRELVQMALSSFKKHMGIEE